MSDAEAESCTHTRWGTLTGLDPALLAELQEHKRCRLERLKLEEEAEPEPEPARMRLWLLRIRSALQRSGK